MSYYGQLSRLLLTPGPELEARYGQHHTRGDASVGWCTGHSQVTSLIGGEFEVLHVVLACRVGQTYLVLYIPARVSVILW